MSVTPKLCNPTPLDAVLNYVSGVDLKIPAFGNITVSIQQLQDYHPQGPGYAAVKENIEYKGLFLLDDDYSYEYQAYNAIKKSIQLKEERYRQARGGIERLAIKNGVLDDKMVDATIEQMGYKKVMEEISELKKIAAEYRDKVGEQTAQLEKQFDPERTIFVLSPPRQFPDKISMQFFLNKPENSEIKKKHESFLNAE